jgi:hypothetical protein
MIYTSCLKNKNQGIRREERIIYLSSYPHMLLLARFFHRNPPFFILLWIVGT